MARRKKQSFGYKIFGAATALLVAVALLLFLPKSCEETTQSEGGYEFGLELAIPQFSVDRESQVIEHVGYTVSYNTGLRNPNWVAYELTAGEVQGTEDRADKFVPDPKVKGTQAVDDDYKRSGWDRGHLAPAADMKWSVVLLITILVFPPLALPTLGLPFGILGIVLTNRAKKSPTASNERKSLKTARILNAISTALLVLKIVLVVIFAVIFIAVLGVAGFFTLFEVDLKFRF